MECILIFLGIFGVGWAGQQIFKAILRWWYYRFDRSSHRIKLILSVKSDTCCAVWPSHTVKKSFYSPPKKKWLKIATSKFLVVPMTLEWWLWTQNVSKRALKSCSYACLVVLVGYSSRLAVANSSFHHHHQHLVAHLLRWPNFACGKLEPESEVPL